MQWLISGTFKDLNYLHNLILFAALHHNLNVFLTFKYQFKLLVEMIFKHSIQAFMREISSSNLNVTKPILNIAQGNEGLYRIDASSPENIRMRGMFKCKLILEHSTIS